MGVALISVLCITALRAHYYIIDRQTFLKN